MRAVAIASVLAVTQVNESTGCSDTEPATVTWSLVDEPGIPEVTEFSVELYGCYDWDVELVDDHIVVDAGWSSCAVAGVVRDGVLVNKSDPIVLTGEDQHIDFGLTAGPIAGIGIEVSPHGCAGVWVKGVRDGYPADLAGMRVGDRIVSVDGQPARELTPREFVRKVTGLPVSPVELEIRRRGEEGTLGMRLQRVRIR